MNEKLNIKGMGCGGCVTSVRNALMGVAGISNVDVSLERKQARFELAAPATRDDAVKAVEEAGYEVIE
ncbi:heavy-metal-associated domain-containing protein [Martelella limonii]|uniref:heavy-metal-associated domain-containing protein n=1 Tax=Martelella limonii TaxID=1647649 RepID=UPI001580BE1F|nr:heavy metal-associated domain-containing protein [Martelella limonii]